jgi:hypothetical protein
LSWTPFHDYLNLNEPDSRDLTVNKTHLSLFVVVALLSPGLFHTRSAQPIPRTAGAKAEPNILYVQNGHRGQALDATHVRLLPGSPFYERQELHRRGYLASLDPDKLLFHYRAVAGLPQPESTIFRLLASPKRLNQSESASNS